MDKQNISAFTLSKPAISLVLTLLIFGLLVSYFYVRWDEISTWFTLRPEFVLAVVGLVYLSVVVGGMLNQILLSHFGLKLHAKEWIPLACIATSLNAVLPSGSGAAARAVYLNKKYYFSIAASTSGFLFSNVVSVLANALFGLGLILALDKLSENNSNLFVLALSTISLMAILIIYLPSLRLFREFFSGSSWRELESTSKINTTDTYFNSSEKSFFRYRFLTFRNRILEKINSVNKGFVSLKNHKLIILQLCCLTLLNTLLYGMRIYLAFWCINQPVSITYCVIAGVLASLSLAFSITPGGLGVREGLLIAAGMAFGILFEHTLVAITIERIVTTAGVWAITPFCLHRLKLRL